MTLAAICGLALAAGVVATRAHADEWDQRTIITVHQPIQVEQVVLDPGTYVLKLMNTQSGHRNVVQIYTADERQLVNTVFAVDAYRPRPTDDTQFTFWETPAGTARALRAWYYPGQLIGQEFFYPDHPREIASTASATNTTPAPPALAALNTAPAEPAQPQAAAAQPAPEPQEPVETAANAAPAEPAPVPEPAAAPAPSRSRRRRASQPASLRRRCLRPPARFRWSD